MSYALSQQQWLELSEDDKTRLEKALTVRIEAPIIHNKNKTARRFAAPPREMTAWRHHASCNTVATPLAWTRLFLGDKFHRRSRAAFAAMNVSDEQHAQGVFVQLREPQRVIVQEVLQLWRQQDGTALLAVYPGCGKTVMSIVLAWMLRLKTMILVHRLVLMDQWVETIHRCLGKDRVRVQVLTPANDLDPSCDMFVMNALNVPKFPVTVFRDIGFLIVDECHLLLAEQLVQSLAFFFPRYLLGLSATPYRRDGLDALFDYFFGAGRVQRALQCPHDVWCIRTSFVMPHVLTRQGQLDWNALLHTQSFHDDRNARLVDLVMAEAPRRSGVLVLCKRVDHVKALRQRFLLRGFDAVAAFTSAQRSFDTDAKVLLTTFQKVGVGFSHDKMDMLVLACDVEEYFLQYLGRVFRRPDQRPLVVDIVDDHPVLRKHFATRRRVYRTCGGVLSFPATW